MTSPRMPAAHLQECRARRHLVCRTLAVLFTLAILGSTWVVPAQADPAVSNPVPPVIEITSVSPPIATPGIAVTISGTLHARPGQPLGAPTVRALLGRRAVVSRDDVTDWATDQSAVSGTEIARTPTLGPVAAGATEPFSIVLPADRTRLPSSRPFGSVPIALEISDGATREGLRTFLGWKARIEFTPMQLAWVVPLTLDADPALSAEDPVARADAWQRQVGPGSRVDRVISGTDAAPVTWALDPALLGRDARSAAQIAADPVTPVLAPLLSRLREASARHTVWALPYADPDLAVSVTADPTDPTVHDLIDRGAAVSAALGVPARADVAWPADGSLQGDREARLRTAFSGNGLRGVLVSSSALAAESGYSTTSARKAPGGTPLLAWDDRLSALMLEARTPAAGALTTQRFIAETAAIVGELPTPTRTFVVAVPRGIDPDPAALKTFFSVMAQTPWLTAIDAERALALSAAARPATGAGQGSWTPPGTPQLDATTLLELGRQRDTVGRVATILGSGEEFRLQWQDTVDQLTSVRWRANPAGWTELRGAAATAVTQATKGIVVSPQTTNFLADEGVLQITVVNDLGVPVEGLQLHLMPTNARMRITKQADPIRIQGHSRATVQARAVAVAAGLVPVNAWLTTADGTQIGQGTTIQIRANPPGTWLYAGFGAVVALVFVSGIVRTLWRSPVRVSARSAKASTLEQAP